MIVDSRRLGEIIDTMARRPSRRAFLRISAGAALASACGRKGAPPSPPAPAPTSVPTPGEQTARVVDSTIVRVASVPTAVEGGLFPALFEGFATRVEVVARPDVYDAARAGKVDLVVSHYGHHDCEQFVLDGLGEWPRTICSNQMALVGPPSDPAGVRGMTDAALAFAKIAAGKHPFVVNRLAGIHYLTEILWHAAGSPSRDGWMIDAGTEKEDAMELASKRGAYSLWGLTPFVRTRKQRTLRLEPLVLADPLLQRLMVAVVVRAPNANQEGARALQAHLLEPATQARIRTTRYPTGDADAVYWVPAGRDNRTTMLPKA